MPRLFLLSSKCLELGQTGGHFAIVIRVWKAFGLRSGPTLCSPRLISNESGIIGLHELMVGWDLLFQAVGTLCLRPYSL